MKRAKLLALAWPSPSKVRMRVSTRSSFPPGRARRPVFLRALKMVQRGADPPILRAIRNRPVGVFRLPSRQPSPNLEVETGNSAAILRPCKTFRVCVATLTRMDRGVDARAFLFARRRRAGNFAAFPMSKSYHVAIAGATGAVGVEMLRVLERRNFPLGKLTLLASARSAGKALEFRGKPVEVRELTASAFDGVDFALFSAGGSISKEFAPAAVKAGAVVIDNSSAFRVDPRVPLVVPEINPEAARSHQGIIANPNCTTAITLLGLWPLHRAFGVKRLWASSYQAVSGSGAKAIEELKLQVEALARGGEVPRAVYPWQIAFNVIPQVDAFLETGYTREEMKMENEGRKIMGLPGFRASVTCVRVPVYRAHSVAVSAEFERPVSLGAAREALGKAPGLRVVDEPCQNGYPVPLHVAGQDDCEIGRLRLDCALDNGLSFWICGDQLLKGAALNAVQIAELLAAD